MRRPGDIMSIDVLVDADVLRMTGTDKRDAAEDVMSLMFKSALRSMVDEGLASLLDDVGRWGEKPYAVRFRVIAESAYVRPEETPDGR